MAEQSISTDFQFIDASKILPVLSCDPLWYRNPKVFVPIEQFVLPDKKGKPEEWIKTREEIKRLFTQALEKEQIFFGNAPEFFNDDDRWAKEHFNKNRSIEKDHPDMIVIHHTSTTTESPTAYLDAMQLIRLYVPIFRRGAFNLTLSHNKNIFPPISSGHSLNHKQTFIGYHYLVRIDGTIEQTLKDGYVGFHAGEYKTNCRSIGIAVVDDLEDKVPGRPVIDAIAKIIKKYQPEMIIGHQEVITTTGKKIDTICPGNLWSSWKPILLGKI